MADFARAWGRASLACGVALVVSLPGQAWAEDITTVQTEVSELQRQAAAAAERANDATIEWQQAQQSVLEKQSELTTSQQQLADSQVRLNRMVSTIYRNGGVDPTLLLLATESDNGLVQSWNTMQVVAHQQDYALTKTRAVEQQLARDSESLLKAERRASKARDKILAAQASIDARLQQSTVVLSQLQAQQQQQLLMQQQQLLIQQQQGASDAADSLVQLPDSITKPAVQYALDQVGKPYKAGATGPAAYDSSGLTKAAWKESGVGLPHSVQGQFNATKRVDVTQLAPGDLIFVYGTDEHVGIYTGDGYFVHAADPRQGVVYEKFLTNKWLSEFAGAGRVTP